MKTKDLEYYRLNAEENYITTPISVLRYITELEATNANITKKIACGFKNWWGELSNREKTNLILNHTEHGTDEELFDLYIKSL